MPKLSKTNGNAKTTKSDKSNGTNAPTSGGFTLPTVSDANRGAWSRVFAATETPNVFRMVRTCKQSAHAPITYGFDIRVDFRGYASDDCRVVPDDIAEYAAASLWIERQREWRENPVTDDPSVCVIDVAAMASAERRAKTAVAPSVAADRAMSKMSKSERDALIAKWVAEHSV